MGRSIEVEVVIVDEENQEIGDLGSIGADAIVKELRSSPWYSDRT